MKLLLSFIIVFFITSLPSFSQNYVVDPSHTAVHCKVLRFGVVKVIGRFNSVSGTVKFDTNDPSNANGEIRIQTESYSANNPEGEKAVKSPAFLDAAKFPEINFQLKSLSKAGNTYTASAALTIHGVTKDVSFPVAINGPLTDLPSGKKSIGISGALTINRLDFGVGGARKTPEGNELIGSTVEIEINALALAN